MKHLKTLLLLILAMMTAGIFQSCDILGMLDDIIKVPQDEEENEETPKEEENGNVKDNDEFVILFTNDFHSQIEPTDDDKGGVLRLKALVDSVRAAEPVVLLADAGDLVQGTYYFSLLNGVVEMKMLDMMGYDIRTIGNHEFDKKMKGLGEMLALSKVPVVASNYDFTATPLSQYVQADRIVDAGRIKVGFIGLNVRLLNLVDPMACEGVVWQDAVNVADRYAEELRNQGADLVIAISHLGYGDAIYQDKGIIRNTRHIDMVIGGHSHTTLRSADYVTDADGSQVPVVQTGSKGLNLGYAKVRLDKKGKPSFEYRLIPVNSRLDDRTDPEFSDIIEAYAADIKVKMDEKLGYSKYNITRSVNSNRQSRLGNLSADGLIWMAKEYYGVDADVSIYNTGGIRANIVNGDITLGDVYAVYPFDNILSILEVTGSNLKELFNTVADGSLPAGGDIKLTISDGNLKSVTVNGKQIVDSQIYTVATIDYLANLGRYGLDSPISRRDGSEFVRDLYGEYFKHIASQNNGYIDGPLDDRIIVEP